MPKLPKALAALALLAGAAPRAQPAPHAEWNGFDAGPAEAPAGASRASASPAVEPHSPATAGQSFAAPANLRVSANAHGATGLAHLSSADFGRPGAVRISVLGEYLSSADFPVLGARDVRSSGAIGLGYVFHPSAEAYLSYASSTNTNTRGSPALMQTQGDLSVGAKGALRAGAGLHLGVDLRFILFPGVGSLEVSRSAVGLAPSALATWDVRAVAPRLPLRLHANAGFFFDKTAGLLDGAPVASAEEFALQINRYHRVRLAAGAEVPLPYATPFVEYGLAYPLGAKGLLGPDGQPVSLASAVPQQLTVGARLTALRDLTILAAVDLGLTRSVARGIPATPPYNLLFGVSYAFDPAASGEPRPATSLAQGPAPAGAPAQAGNVAPPAPNPGAAEAQAAARDPRGAAVQVALVSGKQRERVAGGRVSLCGPQRTLVSVGAQGAAVVELPRGHYTASVDADGYLARTRDFEVAEAGEQRVEVELTPSPKPALVVLREDRIQLKQQVHFAAGKALILPDSNALLDQVTEVIRRAGLKVLRIEGHTDSLGDKAANLKLSRDRASVVLESLVQRGIERSRLVVEGFGDARPLAPNLTARGRELNRRVEFAIVER